MPEVLRQFFGTNDIVFSRTVNAPAVPLPAPMPPLPAKLITRSFDSLSEAAAEWRDARVYAGILFVEEVLDYLKRAGCNDGTLQGGRRSKLIAKRPPWSGLNGVAIVCSQ